MPASCPMSGRRHPSSAWMPAFACSTTISKVRIGTPRRTQTALPSSSIPTPTKTPKRTRLRRPPAPTMSSTPSSGVDALQRGNIFPQFDTVQSGLLGTQRSDAYEGGVNYTASKLRLYGKCLLQQISRIESFDLARTARPSSGTCANTLAPSSTRPWVPSMASRSAPAEPYLHARYADFINGGVDSSGNQVQSQPVWQGRLNLSYQHDVGFGSFTLYYCGNVRGNVSATRPTRRSCRLTTKVDAGALLEITGGEFIRISVDNLNNSGA